MKFIHTADWQIGKPFAGIDDPNKRLLLQRQRIEVIQRIGKAAQDFGADCVLVAGDLFDSCTASKATVSAACSAIGQLRLPVVVIPGNHDHGGPGSVWSQTFFQSERDSLAPNLRVLLAAEPLELHHAWIFPCPLLRRAEPHDTTAWLRSSQATAACSNNKPRIVLAHGSTLDFTNSQDEEDGVSSVTSKIDLSRIPEGEFDYVALGDWHGTKQMNPRAWYSGTPELDRFVKGDLHDPGNVLAVELVRGQSPVVTPIRTARLGWHPLSFHLSEDAALALLDQRIAQLVGSRIDEDLLRLELTGSLGIQAALQLDKLVERLEARLLRVKLLNQVTLAPTESEIQALAQRPSDPLIARVASQLMARARGDDESAATARVGLRELFLACNPA